MCSADMDTGKAMEDLKHFQDTYGDLLEPKGITIRSSLAEATGHGYVALVVWTVENTDTKENEILYQWACSIRDGSFFLRCLLKEVRFITTCQSFLSQQKRTGKTMTDGDVMRDRNALFQDLKNFTLAYSDYLQDFGIGISAGLQTFSQYGNMVRVQWNKLNPETKGHDLLYQSMYILKAGVSAEVDFFLRSLLREQSFVVSCSSVFPKMVELQNENGTHREDKQASGSRVTHNGTEWKETKERKKQSTSFTLTALF